MNDDIQQPQPEEQGQNTEAMPGKKKSKISPYIALFCVAVVVLTVFVEGLAIAFSFIKWREPAPNTTAFANGLYCKSMDNFDPALKVAMQNAAQEFNISPALLGAIYRKEHSGSYTLVNPGYTPNGNGPFQFTTSTWASVSKSFQKCSDPNDLSNCFKPEDVLDVTKSSRAAALHLSDLYKSVLKIYGKPAGTYDELIVKGVALSYNRGAGCAATFCANGGDEQAILDYIKQNPTSFPVRSVGGTVTTPEWYTDIAMSYMALTWQYYQELSGDCRSYTANVPGTLNIPGVALLPILGLHQCDDAWPEMCHAGCSYTALAMIDRYFGGNKTPPQIKATGLGIDGFIANNNEFKLAPSGKITVKPGEAFPAEEIASQLAQKHPVLMHLRTYNSYYKRGHLVVIVGISPDKKHIYIQDPYGQVDNGKPEDWQPKKNGNSPVTHSTDPADYGNIDSNNKFIFWVTEAK